MRTYLHIILLLIAGGTILPQHTTFAQTEGGKKKEINWSVNIKKKKDSLDMTFLNLGLLTNLEEQRGVGINVISSVVRRDMKGMQLAGIMSFSGKNAKGLQIGGLANIAKHNASGVMLSGLMNATNGDAEGMQMAGIVNVTGHQYNGLAIGGLMNVSAEEMNGLQLSGLLNASGGKLRGGQIALLSNVGMSVKGVQVSAVSNIAGKEVSGLQLSSVANIALNSDKALQITSLTNICLGNMKGVQFSLGNYAENVKGCQIGLFNLSTGKVNGWQIGVVNHSKDTTAHKIGLINICPRTRIQPLIFVGNTSKINLGVRFKNRRTYNIIGIGSHYLDLNDKFSGCLYYRTGLYFPVSKRFEVSGDLGYFHIENFENENAEIPERMYSIQARLNVEYKPLRKLGVFASGGYAMTRYYKKNKFFEKEPIVEVGIALF